MTTARDKLRWIAVAVLLVLASMATRSTTEQQRAFAEAESLEKQGKPDLAIVAYRRALRWYTPWGPRHADAATALRRIADESAKHRPGRAVRALDALRSGLIASRWLLQPRAEDLAWANATIPPLLVRVAERRGDKRAAEPAARAALLARFQADYARPVGVPGWVSLLVTLGFLLWMGGLVLAWRKGVGEDGTWQPAGWRWVGASLGGFVTWTLAMWLA